MIIRAKINVSKIEKNLLFKGEKGTYLDVSLLEDRDGEDQWGNSGMIIQDVSREAREAGEKGPIIGNFKIVGNKPSAPARTQSQGRRPSSPLPQRPLPKDPDLDAPDQDIPF